MSREKALLVEKYIQNIGLLQIDENSKNGAYLVNSFYFDTFLLDDYHDKDDSLLIRKKMRARTYEEMWHNSPKNVWIEIKNKRNFNILKERTHITGQEWINFIQDENPICLTKRKDISVEDYKKLKRFSYLYIKGGYRPNIIVKYFRTAYMGSFLSRIRITFDSDISTCWIKEGNTQEDFMVRVYPEKVIMEVKFNTKMPWWFTNMIKVFDLKRVDFSKYHNSVIALRELYNITVNK
jgi:hypothetical protein